MIATAMSRRRYGLHVVVLATVACAHTQDNTMSTPSCSDAIQLLLRKDLTVWRGLPNGCTLADVRGGGFEIGDDEPVRILGEAQEAASYRNARADAFTEHPQIWLRGGAVIRIAVAQPDLPDFAAALQALGPPEAKLDAWSASVPKRIPESEWVWPARGLALILVGGKPPAEQLIVFAPTTLAQYRAQLRYDIAPRELSGR